MGYQRNERGGGRQQAPGARVVAGPGGRPARTQFPEVFAALAAPFPPEEVKTRAAGGGRQLSYITARMAMNRLDLVLGPENWWNEYLTVDDVLFCRLTIRLPDGSTVAKMDAGGFKQMTERNREGQTVEDEENTDKTGPSDAFKRAAVMFGVARYLYNDGVPEFAREPEPTRPATTPADGKAPATPEPLADLIGRSVEHYNGLWAADAPGTPPLVPHANSVMHHFVSGGLANGTIRPDEVSKLGSEARDDARCWRALEGLYRRSPTRFAKALDDYLDSKLDDARAELAPEAAR